MEPFRRKDRDGWWIRFKDADRRWVTRKGGATERDAYVALERFEFEARAIRDGLIDRRQQTARDASRRPVGEVLDEYRDYLVAKGDTSSHVKESLRCCRAVLRAIGAGRLAEIRAGPVEGWLSGLIKGGLSARTRNVYLLRVRAFLNWAVRNELLTENPLTPLETLNEQRDRREVSRALEPEKFDRLIESTPCPKRRAYYLLAGRCGLRWGEIRRLRWADIDLDTGWIDLPARAAKSGRQDMVPMGADVVAALRAIGSRAAKDAEARGAGSSGCDRKRQISVVRSEPVFNSSPTLRTFRRDLERAGIPYETERGQADRKCLRKTFGTHLAMSGVDFRVVVRLMRHTDPRLTMNIYTDPMLLDMKGAVDRLSKEQGAKAPAPSRHAQWCGAGEASDGTRPWAPSGGSKRRP